MLVTLQKTTRRFAAEPLFSEISLTVSRNERIGLIGPNGCGKTTLMRLIAGLEPPDEGLRTVSRGVRVGYVPQHTTVDPAATVTTVVAAALNAPTLDAHEQEIRVALTLGQCGFDDLTVTVDRLSGGWRKRLDIACGLVCEPDLLLLDEPTNHLDLEGILWLEQLLKSASCSSLVVSHDRFFLDTVCTRLVELNPRYPAGVLEVAGGYSDYLEQRESLLEQEYQRMASLASKVRREVDWLRHGPKARTSKARYRIDAAHEMIGALDSQKRRLAEETATLDFAATGRRTKRLLVVEGVAKSLGGKPLFSGISLTLAPGMCLGVLGPNGCGKTTLLRVLIGELPPDAGEARPAEKLRVIWFDQHRSQLDPLLSVKRTLAPETGDFVIVGGENVHVVTWGKRFLLRPDQMDQPVSSLSGGEQSRLLMARLALQPADILVLDEPTNDLDIPSLEVLEESLASFAGAVVIVSHDRYLLDRICTAVVGLNGKGDAALYADFRQWQAALVAAAAAPAERPRKERVKQRAKLSYLEKREWETMEETILDAETRVESLRAKLDDPQIAAHAAQLAAAYDALQAAELEVERLYARWGELEAKQQQ